MSTLHEKHFPNESAEYRDARNKVLEEEIKLRKHVEEVAAMRRSLPLGGKVSEDYVFEELDENGKIIKTKLSEVFKPGKDTLVAYSFMFGPDAKEACSSCTSIIDGINGMVFHVNDRINFVCIAKSDPEKIAGWMKKRGWKNIRFLSSNKNSYNLDYFGENGKGNQMPHLNVFKKTADGIFHTYGSELMFMPPEPGQNERDIDSIWPLWNIFDLTPEGRGTDWYPKNSYSEKTEQKK